MILSVPNVSEGRRPEVVGAIVAAIGATAGVRLLDWSADPDHNRSVFTCAGDAATLTQAVLAIYAVAMTAIDLRTHRGVHPRIGAVDVVPFVPFGATGMSECVRLAGAVGRRIADRFHVPVYLYEEAATRADRRSLAMIRRGEFEGLADRMRRPEWAPDFGPALPHPTAGASAVGARQVLVAYNVNLATDRIEEAEAIAASIRERNGGLPGVKALGLRLRARGIAQVSMNLTDYRRTDLATAFAAVQREAGRRGIQVLESELVGLAPRAAFGSASPEDLLMPEASRDRILEHLLAT